MKKLLSIILIFLLFPNLAACGQSQFDRYKDSFHELTEDPKNRKFKGHENDVYDLSECSYLIELNEWSEQKSKWGKNWWRRNVWRYGTINSHKEFGLDLKNDLTTKILNDKSKHPIYIGPWHFSSRLEKQIRFFAYYPKNGGNIEYQYESMTEDNKNISEKSFSLSKEAKSAPDRFGLCVVKWTAKYGYNAIAEVKSKNPFSEDYLVPTGKIIEVKE